MHGGDTACGRVTEPHSWGDCVRGRFHESPVVRRVRAAARGRARKQARGVGELVLIQVLVR